MTWLGRLLNRLLDWLAGPEEDGDGRDDGDMAP